MLALPSEKAAEIALRTQLVLMEETGVVNVADPLGGSWYVEALTDEIEAEAEAIFARIRDMSADGTMTSGILRGIEDGWFMSEIADAAFTYQQLLEKGDKRVVGVNVDADTVVGAAGDHAGVARGRDRAEPDPRRAPGRRATTPAVREALAAMVEVARGDGNMVPADARGRPARGDARRDLRRAARRVGRLPRARPLLTGARPLLPPARGWARVRPTLGS